jgi:uncharacterized protein YcbK (DUF882 family)
MTITYNELLHGHLLSDVPMAHQFNLEELLIAVNKLRDFWGKPMLVTSGYRSMQDQLRINPAATASNHLIGCAVDFVDPDGALYAFAFANQDKLAEFGIWCEADTVGWLHCQCVPPRSGKRFFKP